MASRAQGVPSHVFGKAILVLRFRDRVARLYADTEQKSPQGVRCVFTGAVAVKSLDTLRHVVVRQVLVQFVSVDTLFFRAGDVEVQIANGEGSAIAIDEKLLQPFW